MWNVAVGLGADLQERKVCFSNSLPEVQGVTSFRTHGKKQEFPQKTRKNKCTNITRGLMDCFGKGSLRGKPITFCHVLIAYTWRIKKKKKKQESQPSVVWKMCPSACIPDSINDGSLHQFTDKKQNIGRKAGQTARSDLRDKTNKAWKVNGYLSASPNPNGRHRSVGSFPGRDC